MENGFFTFGIDKERNSKLISKLHRYLKTSLSSYTQKCAEEIKDYVPLTEYNKLPTSEIIGMAKTSCLWTDFSNQKSELFYVLGPLDEDSTKKPDTELLNNDQADKFTTEKQEQSLRE